MVCYEEFQGTPWFLLAGVLLLTLSDHGVQMATVTCESELQFAISAVIAPVTCHRRLSGVVQITTGDCFAVFGATG